MGYDPDFRAWSPGTLLLGETIRDGCARGDKTFDMGTDRFEYKRRWRTRTIPVSRYAHYTPCSLRTQLLRWKRFLFPEHPAAVGSKA